MLTGSVGQEFRQETVENTYLCFQMSGTQMGRLKTIGRDLNS